MITVVIPTRNRLALLKEAVRSVQSQTDSQWQLIVVDDNSEDGTQEWAERELGGGKFIRLSNNSERAKARNTGLSAAGGDKIVFLDDDDRLMPGALKRLSDALDEASDCVAAVGARVHFDEKGRRRRVGVGWSARRKTVWPDLLFRWIPTFGQMMSRTEIVREAGGFVSGLEPVEDLDLLLKLAHRAPFVLVPSTVLEYRQHLLQSPRHGAAKLDAAIRSAFVESLVGRERRAAERIAAAMAARQTGGNYASQGNWSNALLAYLRAGWTAPYLFRSSLTSPDLLKLIVRAAIGTLSNQRGIKLARRIRGLLEGPPPGSRED